MVIIFNHGVDRLRLRCVLQPYLLSLLPFENVSSSFTFHHAMLQLSSLSGILELDAICFPIATLTVLCLIVCELIYTIIPDILYPLMSRFNFVNYILFKYILLNSSPLEIDTSVKSEPNPE